MYIYMYIYVYMDIHVYLYVYICIFIYMYVYLYIYIYMSALSLPPPPSIYVGMLICIQVDAFWDTSPIRAWRSNWRMRPTLSLAKLVPKWSLVGLNLLNLADFKNRLKKLNTQPAFATFLKPSPELQTKRWKFQTRKLKQFEKRRFVEIKCFVFNHNNFAIRRLGKFFQLLISWRHCSFAS